MPCVRLQGCTQPARLAVNGHGARNLSTDFQRRTGYVEACDGPCQLSVVRTDSHSSLFTVYRFVVFGRWSSEDQADRNRKPRQEAATQWFRRRNCHRRPCVVRRPVASSGVCRCDSAISASRTTVKTDSGTVYWRVGKNRTCGGRIIV